MTYSRTQQGRWHYILLVFALATLAGAWIARSEPMVVNMLLLIAAIFLFCGLVFGSLTVCDEGDWLAVRFGPLPLIGKRICYADITAVETGRSHFIDGWGVHYVPCRGWTYNVWGFGCVKLTLGRKVIRIGSEEPEALAAFIREKAGSKDAAARAGI